MCAVCAVCVVCVVCVVCAVCVACVASGGVATVGDMEEDKGVVLADGVVWFLVKAMLAGVLGVPPAVCALAIIAISLTVP